LEDKRIKIICSICDRVYEFPIKCVPDSIKCKCGYEMDIEE